MFWYIVLSNATPKKQIDAKFLLKIFRAPPGNLSLKTPVLARLITKR